MTPAWKPMLAEHVGKTSSVFVILSNGVARHGEVLRVDDDFVIIRTVVKSGIGELTIALAAIAAVGIEGRREPG